MTSQYKLTEEQESLRATVRRMAEERIAPLADRIDDTGEYPMELVDLFAKMGLLGLTFPQEYGGSEADTLSQCIMIEEVARVDASSSMWVGAAKLACQPIMLAGNEEQKRRVLPQVVAGKKLAAFGLTEPEAGSDVSSLQTRGAREGDHYILNGRKCFITIGNVAEFIITFAATDPAKKSRGISAFIVERGSPGFSVGKVERKMGVHGAPSVELLFEDCRVPVENLLGQEGDGFKIAMRTLTTTRPANGATSVGIAQGALDYAKEYAKGRVQFGKPIAEHQAIQFMMADMAMETEAARHLVYKAATLVDEGSPDLAMVSAMAKCFATDVGIRVTTDALQILGGHGYMKDHPMERYMRDAKLQQIAGGTNEIMRQIMANELLRR